MIKWISAIRWKGVLYSVMGIAVLGGLVVLMGFIDVKSSEQACTELKVIILGDESFIEQKDIMSIIVENHGELVGRTLESIPIHDIEGELKQIPYVHSALVNMDMNGLIAVRIRQRKAVVRVINNAGKDFYIDDEGLKMPVSLKYIPKVPVVNGYIYEPYNEALDSMSSPLMLDVFKTAQYISADSTWSNQIVQLYVNQYRDIELIPRVGRQQIILGNADSLDKKFEKLMLFYRKIVPKTGVEAYKSVNLKYAGQLVCERNEKYHPVLIKAEKENGNQDTVNSSINTQ